MKKKNSSLYLKLSFMLPLLMSAAGLTLIFSHLAIYGTVKETDEGTAAHLWQLLMAGQIPFLTYFAVVHLPKQPKKSLTTLVVLVLFWIANFASLFYFERIK